VNYLFKDKLKNKLFKIKRILLIKDSVKPSELFSQLIRVLVSDNRHFSEEKKSFGSKNPDDRFYVIRRTPPGAGLFSNFLLVLMHLYYAEQYGYKPIVDYKNYSNFYKEKDLINNSSNSWEYYFNQPINTPLEEVYKSSNVILSSANVSRHLEKEFLIKDLNQSEFMNNKKQVQKFHQLYKSMGLNQYTKTHTEKQLDALFKDKKNVLGIVLRGTDYLNKDLSRGHQMPFEISNSIEIVESYLVKWSVDNIYLSTEVSEYVEIYKKHFGDKLISLPRDRYLNKQNKKFINQYTRKRKNDKYLTGLEYLTEVYGLARCSSIIGTSCGSLNAAIIINNYKYLNKKVFDLGINY
jgi:hypothetical protein